jgi:Ca2+-binding EF-hand superfamily protein
MNRTAALTASTLIAIGLVNLSSAAVHAGDDANGADQAGTREAADAKSQGATSTDKTTNAENAALFDKLDVNHDGQITADEVPEEQRRLFNRLLRRADKNGDGKLSREEFLVGMANDHPKHQAEEPSAAENKADQPTAAAMDKKPNDGQPTTGGGFGFGGGGFGGGTGGGFGGGGFAGGAGPGPFMGIALFHALDTNGDGKLDAKEIAAAADVLKKLANTQGEITREELLKTLPPGMGPGPGGFAGRAAGFGGGAGGAGGFGGGTASGIVAGKGGLAKALAGDPNGANAEEGVKRVLAMFDKNGDGKLEKSELPPHMQEHFEELDTNHDGVLDEAEIKAIMPRLLRRIQDTGASAEKPAAK